MENGALAVAGKTQAIRLADVFALGPFMIYLAMKSNRLSSLEKLALGGIGVATIFYNWKNYREVAEENPATGGVRG